MKEEEVADVEYVPESLDDPAALEAFADVFARFKLPQDNNKVQITPSLPPVTVLRYSL